MPWTEDANPVPDEGLRVDDATIELQPGVEEEEGPKLYSTVGAPSARYLRIRI